MFKESNYIISAVSSKQYPNHNNLNEYVFLGRSNVGKSSFINALTNRKNLARTSGKPGKTITINFYLIDNAFYLVDVPGYGYAQRSIKQRLEFGNFIDEYLTTNPNLRTAFLLVDSRHKPTNDDILMYEYLKHLNINVIVIGTKADKIGTTRRLTHKKIIEQSLKISKEDKVILTSSETRLGLDELYQYFK